MIYTISNKTTKQDKNGKDYIRATLTDTNGEVFENIGAFRGEFVGDTFDGELEKNGNYWNLKAKVVLTANFPSSKTNQVAAAQARTSEYVEKAQDAKAEAIALAGSITNGTNLTIAESEAGLLEGKDYHTRVRENIMFYQNMYKHPEAINPSASNAPF